MTHVALTSMGSCVLGLLKGCLAVSRTYISTPSVHQSTLWLYPRPSTAWWGVGRQAKQHMWRKRVEGTSVRNSADLMQSTACRLSSHDGV